MAVFHSVFSSPIPLADRGGGSGRGIVDLGDAYMGDTARGADRLRGVDCHWYPLGNLSFRFTISDSNALSDVDHHPVHAGCRGCSDYRRDAWRR